MTEQHITDINEFARKVHENAVRHGFWEPEPSFGEIIALCHSELSEALEAYRDRKPLAYTVRSGMVSYPETDMSKWRPGDKPDGVAVELADCLIRIMDWFGSQPELDLEKILRAKHEYNKTRPHRHGGKRL